MTAKSICVPRPVEQDTSAPEGDLNQAAHALQPIAVANDIRPNIPVAKTNKGTPQGEQQCSQSTELAQVDATEPNAITQVQHTTGNGEPTQVQKDDGPINGCGAQEPTFLMAHVIDCSSGIQIRPCQNGGATRIGNLGLAAGLGSRGRPISAITVPQGVQLDTLHVVTDQVLSHPNDVQLAFAFSQEPHELGMGLRSGLRDVGSVKVDNVMTFSTNTAGCATH